MTTSPSQPLTSRLTASGLASVADGYERMVAEGVSDLDSLFAVHAAAARSTSAKVAA